MDSGLKEFNDQLLANVIHGEGFVLPYLVRA
jgi:hypothetical protein